MTASRVALTVFSDHTVFRRWRQAAKPAFATGMNAKTMLRAPPGERR